MANAQVPVELVIAAFKEERGADEALKELKEAKKEKLIGIRDAAVIRRDMSSKLHIHETGDMSGGQGATIGAVVGGALGLLTGPGVILTGAAGALIGGLAARLSDSGFPDERLREIGAALTPGTSAIVAEIEHTWVTEIEREFAAQGARVMTQAVQDDITRQLQAGEGVAYSAIATGETVVFDRWSAVGEEPPGGAVRGEKAAGTAEKEIQVPVSEAPPEAPTAEAAPPPAQSATPPSPQAVPPEEQPPV